MLADTYSSRWSTSNGAASVSCRRSATIEAPRTSSISSSSSVNSSPPWRATVSPGRSAASMRLATAISRRSPTMWPSESLTSLKRSRSQNSTAQQNSSSWRRERFRLSCRRSRKSARLGSPVSGVVQRVVAQLRQLAERARRDDRVGRVGGFLGRADPPELIARRGELAQQLLGVLAIVVARDEHGDRPRRQVTHRPSLTVHVRDLRPLTRCWRVQSAHVRAPTVSCHARAPIRRRRAARARGLDRRRRRRGRRDHVDPRHDDRQRRARDAVARARRAAEHDPVGLDRLPARARDGDPADRLDDRALRLEADLDDLGRRCSASAARCAAWRGRRSR